MFCHEKLLESIAETAIQHSSAASQETSPSQVKTLNRFNHWTWYVQTPMLNDRQGRCKDFFSRKHCRNWSNLTSSRFVNLGGDYPPTMVIAWCNIWIQNCKPAQIGLFCSCFVRWMASTRFSQYHIGPEKGCFSVVLPLPPVAIRCAVEAWARLVLVNDELIDAIGKASLAKVERMNQQDMLLIWVQQSSQHCFFSGNLDQKLKFYQFTTIHYFFYWEWWQVSSVLCLWKYVSLRGFGQHSLVLCSTGDPRCSLDLRHCLPGIDGVFRRDQDGGSPRGGIKVFHGISKNSVEFNHFTNPSNGLGPGRFDGWFMSQFLVDLLVIFITLPKLKKWFLEDHFPFGKFTFLLFRGNAKLQNHRCWDLWGHVKVARDLALLAWSLTKHCA